MFLDDKMWILVKFTLNVISRGWIMINQHIFTEGSDSAKSTSGQFDAKNQYT